MILCQISKKSCKQLFVLSFYTSQNKKHFNWSLSAKVIRAGVYVISCGKQQAWGGLRNDDEINLNSLFWTIRKIGDDSAKTLLVEPRAHLSFHTRQNRTLIGVIQQAQSGRNHWFSHTFLILLSTKSSAKKLQKMTFFVGASAPCCKAPWLR